MSNERDRAKPATEQKDYSGQRQQAKPMDDLDSSPDEAEQVKGGARPRPPGDPCDGGE